MTRKKGTGKIMRNKKDGEKRKNKTINSLARKYNTKSKDKWIKSMMGHSLLRIRGTLCPATSQHPSVDYFHRFL